MPPERCPEDATSTQRWGSHAGATATGVSTAFFLRVFICPVFKASARGSPWPAADTALRQEIGAAACCLRLPLYAAAFSPRPTCKVCFLKTFLWKIWIGCLVFETFVNGLLRALTVAQGRQSRRHQRKRPMTPSIGVRPRSSNKDPARHIVILSFLRRTAIHLVQRHECSHLHIYHARILPGAQQGHPEPLFSEPPRGGPRKNIFKFYIYIYFIYNHKVSCHTWKLYRRQQVKVCSRRHHCRMLDQERNRRVHAKNGNTAAMMFGP